MRILAVNSSPRTGAGSKTEIMLDRLAEGMRDAGGDVTVVNLREKKIKPCIGCFTCWTKTPGRCVHQDDMSRAIFPQWCEADLAVYATPLYYHTMNGAMCIFKERTLPVMEPFLHLDDQGRTYHPLRRKVPAAVWLSVCGFPELSEFDALSDYLHRTRHKDVSIAAEIYRPAAEAMTNSYFSGIARDVLDATRQAGRELVHGLRVAPETMERITQPFMDAAGFAEMGNLFWKTCIAEDVTPKTFFEQDMVPRPDSPSSFIRLMPAGLNPAAAGDRRVVMQFRFSGEVRADCYFVIAKGRVEGHMGVRDDADVAIETPFEVWMDIMTRKADGQQLFFDKAYAVSGDLSLMLALFDRA